MQDWFAVEHLDVERLLADWRWLCPESMILVARSAFGDLFLRDASGKIYLLDVAVGKLTKIADTETEFRDLAATNEKREQWFAQADEQAAAGRGLNPNAEQCIGFSTPLVFAESGHPGNPCVADLYEHVSFLGDLNRQIAESPDGTKVRLQIAPEPPEARYLQSDGLENWKRRLREMDDSELELHQERLKRSIDFQAAKGLEKSRLESMLEECNIRRAELGSPQEIERKLLVSTEGYVPWTVSPLNTLSIEKQIEKIVCATCRRGFKIHCEDDIPADELNRVRQLAAEEAARQFKDLHATLAGHPESMPIHVKYFPGKRSR